MDEFKDKNGEITGFDEAKSENDADNATGYTVTPEGSFYTKQKEDIIQDEVFERPKNESENRTEQYEPQSHNREYSTLEGEFSNYSAPGYNFLQQPKKKKEKKGFSLGSVILAVILSAVIGGLSGVAVLKAVNPDKNTVTDTNPTKNLININIDEEAESVVEAVAEKVTPSVVGIKTTTSVISFFGGSSESTGEGSGVIYSADGYIITNYHVISEAASNKNGSKIEVYIDNADSKAYTAAVVGYNISSDLAVIKINASGLTPIEIADSSALKVGQYVITVGNPGGLEFMDSVTYGVISGLNRVVSSDSGVELIQTDAAINPGNSGGALVNTKGQLVGINSSKIVSEQFEGMGFAIPSNTTVKICKNIISKENSPEPYIGVSISERYTAEVLKYYGYPVGAVVLSVADSSPADDAGLEKGDIITEFNGKTIKEYSELEDLIADCSPGQSVQVKIYRAGRYYTTNIKVASNNQVK